MIQIITCLTGNSAPYAEHLKKNLLELAHDVKSIVGFSAIADDTFDDDTSWSICEVVPRKYPNASANHGQMLNRVIKHIHEKTTILVIADADVAVLQKDWDLMLRGVEISHKPLITPKFSGAAGVFFLAFPAEVYKLQAPDFMPGTEENGFLVKTAMMDTGWRLASTFREYYPTYLEYHDRRDDGSNLEYLYHTPDGMPFVSHMGASHKTDFDSERAQNWIKAIKNLQQ